MYYILCIVINLLKLKKIIILKKKIFHSIFEKNRWDYFKIRKDLGFGDKIRR